MPLHRHRILTPHLNHTSVLNLNAVLFESADSFEVAFGHEVPSLISHGIRSKDVSFLRARY